ncbi:MAG: TonB-dependent receptor, partial [Thermoanaerobaculia bacterium]|nr:TonB-dependent receptor [Thermoanaerobaculia bacterium]
LFGAFRWDHHPQWGSELTPRLGAIWSGERSRLRLSWQTGFRGAVGVHYSGGFRRDGLLREENFDEIENHSLLEDFGFSNISPTEPEEISSLELAGHLLVTPALSIEGVVFRNEVENVIDVGVIFIDPAEAVIAGQQVGTDLVGDWNGLFYFKNNRGTIDQLGLEASLRWKAGLADVHASHSHVEVRDADPDQFGGSMYLTGTPDDPHFKAFPEDVTRLNLMIRPDENWSIGVNYLYYWRWYSPLDTRVDANHILNASASWSFGRGIRLTLSGKNLFDQDELYPMNNNASDAALSSGTPALESRTFWLRAGYSF